MPYRDTVDHQTVFDILHTAFLHCSEKRFLLHILEEDMLVFFIDRKPAVTLEILEEIFSALLESQRMKLRIDGIPIIFIRDCINVVNTRIVHEQRLCYLLKDRILHNSHSIIPLLFAYFLQGFLQSRNLT